MCNKCEGFSQRLRISNPREYLDLVMQLDALVKTGIFRLIQSTCPLAELLENRQWPSDAVAHVFECSNCGQRFRLVVEAYHGAGGSWEMVLSEGSRSV